MTRWLVLCLHGQGATRRYRACSYRRKEKTETDSSPVRVKKHRAPVRLHFESTRHILAPARVSQSSFPENTGGTRGFLPHPKRTPHPPPLHPTSNGAPTRAARHATEERASRRAPATRSRPRARRSGECSCLPQECSSERARWAAWVWGAAKGSCTCTCATVDTTSPTRRRRRETALPAEWRRGARAPVTARERGRWRRRRRRAFGRIPPRWGYSGTSTIVR